MAFYILVAWNKGEVLTSPSTQENTLVLLLMLLLKGRTGFLRPTMSHTVEGMRVEGNGNGVIMGKKYQKEPNSF